MNEGLTIQQVAQRTGLSIHTLRYYEHLGLLVAVHRLPNGHRRYDESDLQWLDLLKCLRTSAMPISEMQRFAELKREGDTTASERIELLENHRSKVLSQIEELHRALEQLDVKIARLHTIEANSIQSQERESVAAQP